MSIHALEMTEEFWDLVTPFLTPYEAVVVDDGSGKPQYLPIWRDENGKEFVFIPFTVEQVDERTALATPANITVRREKFFFRTRKTQQKDQQHGQQLDVKQ